MSHSVRHCRDCNALSGFWSRHPGKIARLFRTASTPAPRRHIGRNWRIPRAALPAPVSAGMGAPMRLYHRTTQTNANLILREGFRNRKERYTSDFSVEGVWFSDCPKEATECDGDEAVVSVDFAFPASSISAFEWVEDETSYKEWLIPLTFVNSNMTKARIC
jgi:hypothetical protein